MKIGKLDNATLERLILSKFKNKRSEVLYPPLVGVDCAKLKLDDGLAVLSTDPITASVEQLGKLTVHINCNDVATAGAEPVGLLVTILAPPTVTEAELDKLSSDIAVAADEINVDIIGGHTEVTDAVTRIITSSTVIAKPIIKDSFYEFGKLNSGDELVMTKYAGLEGTSIIATDYDVKTLTADELKFARGMADSISVVKEGLYAAANGAVAMHDVTEGGILGAVWEMAYASGVGCIIDIGAIPVHPVTKKLCAEFKIDPYRLISSGSMLIACADGKKMADELNAIGVCACVIGKVTAETSIIDTDGNVIAPPEADEIYSVGVR